MIQCFFIVPVDQAELSFRRFSSGSSCSGKNSYHNTSNPVGHVELYIAPGGTYAGNATVSPDHSDPRWPTHCDCGYRFAEEDEWQVPQHRLYRTQEGVLYTLKDVPAGAMWYADWGFRKGPDGHAVCVKTPGGDWLIDNRASNCTMPDDNEHYCWCRHGDVPNLTVDKIGNTCGAGSGSIGQKTYHGFLRNGCLVNA